MKRPEGWLLLLPLLLAPAPAPAAGWSHDLDVTLDPAEHTLKAVDRVAAGEAESGALRFELHSGLRITSFTIGGKDSLAKLEKGSTSSAGHLSSWQGPPLAAGARLELRYEGVVHDPVKEEGTLGFVAGDVSTGIIGPEGIFLDGGTGWVPLLKTAGGALTRYDVTTRIPEPWRVVTQGRVDKPVRSQKGWSVARWVAEVPSDGLALVAGRYQVKSVDHGGVRISTYFFEEEGPLADRFLESTGEYLDRFAAVLTPYPYSRFDIVENFFTTGYGFPSFTLLGQDVVKMGEMALRPGYVDHEVMHCWWGNYVYPDYETGNWSEGLTTYFANYLAQEAAGPEAAADYRRNLAVKYSLRVKPDLDYPLALFKDKKLDFENEIGYGKAAMLFHMLRRLSGDEKFFGVMRSMATRFGGKRAGWADFRSAFEEATGRNLREIFTEWLDRKGLPILAFGEVRSERGSGGRFLVTGEIIQEGGGAPWHVSLPLTVQTARGRRDFTLPLVEARTPFAFEVDSMPIEVRIDPDGHLLRHLAPTEMPPCLNAVLEDERKTYVIPSSLAGRQDDPYVQLAARAAASKGGRTKRDAEVGQEDLSGGSLLLMGRPEENGLTRDLIGKFVPPLKVTQEGFTVAGETFKGADYSLMMSARNPVDPNHVLALYFGMSPESLARSRYALFYGWDSWVVFKAGRPERRGTFESDDPRSRRLLLEDVTSGISAGPLMDHVRALVSPPMEGRRPGTPGHDAAAAWLEGRLAEIGLAPPGSITPFAEGYRQPFVLPLADLDAADGKSGVVQVRRSSGVVSFDARPFPFLPPAATGGSVDFTGEALFLEPDDLIYLAGAPQVSSRLDGGIVITVERSLAVEQVAEGTSPRGRPEIDPKAAATLAGAVTACARLGAAALVVVRGAEGPSTLEPLLSYPSSPSPDDVTTLKERRKAGAFAGADLFFSGRASRIPLSAPAPSMLVLSVGPEMGAEILGPQRFARVAAEPMVAPEPGARPILLDLEISATAALRRHEVPMANLLGWLQGSDPALSGEVLLVTAHYDAMGRAEDGALLGGASDNAAGAAALLETARWLAAPERRPSRGILFALLDGEEWGLAGSRALAGRLKELSVRLTAVVNIDSLGTGDPSSVYLIGGSHQPDIRTLVERAAPLMALRLGRDIDPFAFDYGSDYYPFHLEGIPAVGFFAADYRSLHRPTDTIEALNADALARTARLAALTVWALAN
jgi:hypothetical protein